MPADPETERQMKMTKIEVLEIAAARVGFPLEASHAETIALAMEVLTDMFEDQDVLIRKRLIQCAANVYPVAFLVICTIKADLSTWQRMEQVKTKIVGFSRDENIGVRFHVVKFIEMLIMQASFRDAAFGPLDSRRFEICLDICPRNHPFVNIAAIETEGGHLLTYMLQLILDKGTPAALITATINALFPIVSVRSQFIETVTIVLLDFAKDAKDYLSTLEQKSVFRTLKNELLAILSLQAPEVLKLISKISETVAKLGAKPHEIASRAKRDSASLKRGASDSFDASSGKRGRWEDADTASPFPPDFDVTTLPLPLVAEFVVQSLTPGTIESWVESLQTYLAQTSAPAATLIPPVVPRAPPAKRTRDPRLRAAASAPQATEIQSVIPIPDAAPSTAATVAFNFDPNQQTPEAFQTLLQSLGLNISALLQPPAGLMTDLGGNIPMATLPSDVALAKIAIPEQQVVVPEALFDPLSVPVPVYELQEDALQVANEAIERILEMEASFVIPSLQVATQTQSQEGKGAQFVPTFEMTSATDTLPCAKSGWMLLVLRLVTIYPRDGDGDGKDKHMEDDSLLNMMLDFVLNDFKNRQELAILWLYEEYRLSLLEVLDLPYNMDQNEDPVLSSNSRYTNLFMSILRGLRGDGRWPGLDSKDRTFTRFLVDAPWLPQEAIEEVVVSYSEDPERMQLGLSTLRDLILLRPPFRKRCLELLLSFCIHEAKITRSNAILIVKRWVAPDHPSLGKEVENFAIKMLRILLDPPAHKFEDNDGMDLKESLENESIRHFELFFALCSKKHELLAELFAIFGNLPKDVAEHILKHIEPLIKFISSSVDTKLIGFLRNFERSAEPLASRIVHILCDLDKKTDSLVKTVFEAFKEFDLGAEFVLPVLSNLGKDELLATIPKLLGMLDADEDQAAMAEEAIVKSISPKPASIEFPEGRPPALSPAEFVVAVQKLEEKDGVKLKECFKGVQMCFKHPEIYKQEVLGAVISQLIELPKTPILFMKTVLESVKLYPQLTRFTVTILVRLVSKKVWKDKHLWEGFIRCCALIAPDSFPTLLGLPEAQIRTVLEKSPGLKPKLLEYIAQLPPQQMTQLRLFLWIPTRKLLEAGITFLTQTLSSDKTQRSALGVIVFSCLLLGLLSTSSLTYGVFYWLYIPRVTHLVPIFLQYPSTFSDVASTIPYAVADLRQKIDVNSGLKHEQHYNLGLQLWVPNSEKNLALGNFMVSMELHSQGNKTLAIANRPVLLKYKSDLLRTLSTLTGAIPLLFGTSFEAQVLNVPLIEDYVETKEHAAHHATIQISTADLQVYDSFITVEAHFQGLRYFMYHWSATTASVFISFFMFWYSMVGLVLWRMFVSWFQNASRAGKDAAPKKELWKEKAELLDDVDMQPVPPSDDSSDEEHQDQVTNVGGTFHEQSQAGRVTMIETNANVAQTSSDPYHLSGPSLVSPTSPNEFNLLETAVSPGTSLQHTSFAAPHPSPSNNSYLPGMITTPATGVPPNVNSGDRSEMRDIFDDDRGFKRPN
ncbi:hypothetical protein HDU97_001955 [Phlyctochytrium planicorne]|nr:hypothetical protein HDU97_001955 [Phlyctochytrium planicorne]